MKINMKILIPLIVIIIVVIIVTILLLTPRGGGGGGGEPTSGTTENTISPTTTTEETQTLGFEVKGVNVGYYDYFDPYNPEKINAGMRGLIEVKVNFTGYATVKQIIIEIKNYGNLTIVSTPLIIGTTEVDMRQFSLPLSMTDQSSNSILESLKSYKVKVYIIYEENGVEKSVSSIAIPADLAKSTTTPR